ncbi:MAG: hypothetical protein AAF665_07740 [Pseudomonadota bacterium]
MADQTENPQAQDKAPRSTPLGIYDRQKAEGAGSIELIAGVVSGIWLVGAAAFFLLVPSDAASGGEGAATLRLIMTMLAICLPIAMIWVAATAARAAKTMREESQRLQSSIDAIRQAYVAQNQSGVKGVEPASVAAKLDEIAAATRKAETVLATFSSRRDAPTRLPEQATTEQPHADQPALALGTRAEDLAPPVDATDFIRALNFPETAEDEDGFAALRRALKDRPSAQLIQAAQDILTLLSQDGIYMDDLRPDRARPEIWRQFGQGMRGRPIAALGGIRDRSSLALTAGRMKQDPIFRDAAHHFLRLFDKSFASFENSASDGEIAALAETRTARAFMLLGRVAGTFD